MLASSLPASVLVWVVSELLAMLAAARHNRQPAPGRCVSAVGITISTPTLPLLAFNRLASSATGVCGAVAQPTKATKEPNAIQARSILIIIPSGYEVTKNAHPNNW